MAKAKLKPSRAKAFIGKDASRWKKEGNLRSMTDFSRYKSNKWWK